VHVLDVYEHYRYRALQRDMKDKGKQLDGGALATDDSWLTRHLAPDRSALARYLGSQTAGAVADAASGQARKTASLWQRWFSRR
jgi:hypothetical protein